MTRRSIINLSAFAIIAAGGLTLLDATSAAAAFDSGCQKMQKRINAESAACTESGGTYSYVGTCSPTEINYSLDSTCTM